MSQGKAPSESGLGRAHIGDAGELWFAAALPRGWVWQPPRRDFGKDGLIVIQDGTALHNLEFSVQIKTTAHPRIRDGAVLVSGVSRSSIRYWFASPLPTLVVAVDINTRAGWYAWHLDLFQSPDEFFHNRAETLTLRIPQINSLNEAGWLSIRAAIFRHFRSLQRALSADAIDSALLPTLYSIARIAANLMRLGSTAPPEPPLTERETMSLLIEQLEVRDLLHYVRTFLEQIPSGSPAHKQVSFWMAAFEEVATAAHPGLELLPSKGQDIPAGLQLAYAPKRLRETRPQVILAAVDLLALLTSPDPQSPRDEGLDKPNRPGEAV